MLQSTLSRASILHLSQKSIVIQKGDLRRSPGTTLFINLLHFFSGSRRFSTRNDCRNWLIQYFMMVKALEIVFWIR
jgi:hypothetical protein